MGGAYANIKVEDMLDGYNNTEAANVNGGAYFQGYSQSLTSLTQPVNRVELVEYGMYTGSNGVEEIGYLRIIDDVAFTNKLMQIYNGTEQVYYNQKDESFELQQQLLNEISVGMQFPPFIETDDQLRTYDTRNIKINTYIHEKSSTIGDDELKIEKFSQNSYGGDISFAYNLPVYETGY